MLVPQRYVEIIPLLSQKRSEQWKENTLRNAKRKFRNGFQRLGTRASNLPYILSIVSQQGRPISMKRSKRSLHKTPLPYRAYPWLLWPNSGEDQVQHPISLSMGTQETETDNTKYHTIQYKIGGQKINSKRSHAIASPSTYSTTCPHWSFNKYHQTT